MERNIAANVDPAAADSANLKKRSQVHDIEAGTPLSAADQKYFSSYVDLDVHALMLKDRPRTLAYKKYIENNPELFRDKIVLDVGAGTGILSLFAAKSGARQVGIVEQPFVEWNYR